MDVKSVRENFNQQFDDAPVADTQSVREGFNKQFATPYVPRNQEQERPENVPKQPGTHFSPEEMVSNIPSSAKQYFKDIVHPFMNWEETVNTFKELGFTGTMYAMKDMYVKRYGSVEQALNTVEQDPVGALADISFVFGIPGLASKAPGVVGKVAKAAKTVSDVTDPINIGKALFVRTPWNIASDWNKATSPVPGGFTTTLYDKGAKFSGNKHLNKSQVAVEHGLKTTERGVDQATKRIRVLQEMKAKALRESARQGRFVSKADIKARIRAELDIQRSKYGPPNANAAKNLEQIDDLERSTFASIDATGNTSFLTPNELETLKESFQTIAAHDKKVPDMTVARVKAARQAQRVTKEMVEEISDVKNINKELSDLYGLVSHEKPGPLQSAAKNVSRQSMMRMVAPISWSAGGYYLGGPYGLAAAAAYSLYSNPLMKQRAAIVLNNMQKTGIFESGITFQLVEHSSRASAQTGRLTEEQQ